MQDKKEDRLAVYEIGYLIASSIPEEKLGAEVDVMKKIITDAGATIVSEEMPQEQDLAYTIRRKTVAGSYEKFDKAYFGWVKFEVSSSSIEAIKKAVEIIPSVVRMLMISTVKENTYLGKHVPVVGSKGIIADDEKAASDVVAPVVSAAPATTEEIDKSIDDMVKEA